MNSVGYLIGAYAGAAVLYVGYLVLQRAKERDLERKVRGRSR